METHPHAGPQESPGAVDVHEPDLHEMVRRRAEEIYERNGRVAGHDAENWAQAEQEIAREATERQHETSRFSIIVHVNGVQYVGEYSLASANGYTPGEFTKGVSVPVRFHGEKMFIRRPNGKELETTIVKRF